MSVLEVCVRHKSSHLSLQSVLVKCEKVCVCVCARVSKGLNPQGAVSLQCVYVVWWALWWAAFHAGFGATQLMGQLAQTQNPSGLIRAPHHCQPQPSFFKFLFSPQPFLPFHCHPFCQPCVACNCPAPLAGTYITPPERERDRERASQLAALTLIDLAPMLTQTPGETFRRGRHGRVWEWILGVRGGGIGLVLANSWQRWEVYL